jgi:hypothetical protein
MRGMKLYQSGKETLLINPCRITVATYPYRNLSRQRVNEVFDIRSSHVPFKSLKSKTYRWSEHSQYSYKSFDTNNFD